MVTIKLRQLTGTKGDIFAYFSPGDIHKGLREPRPPKARRYSRDLPQVPLGNINGMHSSLETAHFSTLTARLILPGAGLMVVLLALYAYAAWYPVSRRHLDRVSFRLLVYALVANLTFGIVFIIVTLIQSPGWECGFLMFLVNLSLVFSAGMFFCIGINLPLVLSFNLNGQRMEKYYIMGTVFISSVCNIIPFASGQFGWDTNVQQCWYRSTDPASRLRWYIGTQTVWLLLASFGEVVAFLIVIGHLVAYERLATGLQFRAEANVHRNIILRIGKLPSSFQALKIDTKITDRPVPLGVMSAYHIYVDLGSAWTELHRTNRTQSEIKPRRCVALVRLPPYVFKSLDLALFSTRPLIYGLLAATDPSFLRAMRELHPGSKNSSDLESRTQGAAPRFSTILELPLTTVESKSRKDYMLEPLELGQTTKGNSGTPENGGEEEPAGLPVHALDPAMHSSGISINM
ncbi:hypothetical protein DFH08DRAFT_996623 [Mycena albidolilacea]|uniref:G-protein coupled receptors family 2 profile 2 domain-containing protein n=1 Tax=Mycena albidolilacea TaxID=1033008 RepID=A0AAD6YX22_9AGAR|nr:hypothetical protein DFH08DRAFT_996623 [Mycena albidolilacea]